MTISSRKGQINAMPLAVAGILVVLLAGVFVYYKLSSSMPEADVTGEAGDAMMEKKEGEAMMDKEEGAAMEKKEGEAMMEKDGAMMEKDGDAMKKEEGTMMEKKPGEGATAYMGTVLAGKSSPLLAFNKADYDKAVASGKLVVLYFYANWCPICRAEFPRVEQAFNSLSGDQVVGFRVNFNDNETDQAEKDLAREHGVAYQHTKVFVKGGTRILKAPDSWDAARYTSEINKAI